MEVKPGDLLIGVVDLFAILLPGALFLALLAYAGEKHLIPKLTGIKENTQRWIALLFAAYILGHFISIVSPRLLYVYARAYRPRSVLSYRERSKALAAAYLKAGYRPGDDIQVWAQTVVQLQNPSASAVLDRIEADAKFFRGLVLVSLMAFPVVLWRKRWGLVILCLTFASLALVCFMDLQVNRETKTYQFFMAIATSKKDSSPSGK